MTSAVQVVQEAFLDFPSLNSVPLIDADIDIEFPVVRDELEDRNLGLGDDSHFVCYLRAFERVRQGA